MGGPRYGGSCSLVAWIRFLMKVRGQRARSKRSARLMVGVTVGCWGCRCRRRPPTRLLLPEPLRVHPPVAF